MRGAPPHPQLSAPHEWVQVDVTDYGQVHGAVSGCDAVINLTVNRSERRAAFRVNLGGAHNIFRASVAHGVDRVIQTGPIHVESMDFEGDYRYEFDMDEGAPFRPASDLYGLTKHLSYETADAFAREQDLDIMTFIVSRLRPHDQYDDRTGNVVIPFSTAWDDLGSAFVAGLRAPRMPHPNERFYICAELPMGKYSAEKAERLLGWKASHTFEDFYRLSRKPPR
jgi:nucleoside-diphosphate-sugar epimerase